MTARDLNDYEQEYLNQPYEKYQVLFRRRNTIESLKRHDHKNILEVGCGLEPLFQELKDFSSFVTIEPAGAFYEAAEAMRKTHMLREKIKLHKMTLEEFTNEPSTQSFNFIMLSSLLHEIESPKEMLQAVKKIASPDTVIHINVPNAKSFHRLLALEMGLINDVFQKSESQVKFQQHTTFDQEKLSNLIQDCGFKVIETGSYAVKPFTHAQMQLMIDQKLLTEPMLEGLSKMARHMPNLGSEIYANIKLAD